MAPTKGEKLNTLKKKSKTPAKKSVSQATSSKKSTANLAELKKRSVTPKKAVTIEKVKELKKVASNRALVREKTQDLKQLFSHAIIYVAVNAFLIFINYVYFKDYWWFYWVLIGWGIGLAFHWLDVMNYSPINEKWVAEEAKKIVNKE